MRFLTRVDHLSVPAARDEMRDEIVVDMAVIRKAVEHHEGGVAARIVAHIDIAATSGGRMWCGYPGKRLARGSAAVGQWAQVKTTAGLAIALPVSVDW